jgi:HlyD family secretion protein
MDIPRQTSKRRKLIQRIGLGILGCAGLLALTLSAARVQPATPKAERGSLWIETVKSGSMTRQVRGAGTLVPEEVLWIPALTDARVDRVLVRPGAAVQEGTVLLVLSNPEVELAAVDAEYQLKTAEAQLSSRRVQLQSQCLSQQTEVARVESEYLQARLKADRNQMLEKNGLIAPIDVSLSVTTAEELAKRLKLERERLEIDAESTRAILAAEIAQIEKTRALGRVKRQQAEALRVRAGSPGVVQQVPVEAGQRVMAGAVLAKVARPERLKAELRIPETQAKDVQIGQPAEIDTRNGVVRGRVARIDPAVREGSVIVDVSPDGTLPKGARPDLSIDGVIELESLANVVHVGRPATGQPGGTVTMFRLEADGRQAVSVQVKLGRASASTIEILSGLRPGDRVILSDTTAWAGNERIQVE